MYGGSCLSHCGLVVEEAAACFGHLLRSIQLPVGGLANGRGSGDLPWLRSCRAVSFDPQGSELDASSRSCPGLQDAAVPLTDTEVHWAPCQGASVGGPESRCVNSASSCGRHDDAQEQGTATSVTHVWVCRTSSNGCRRLREIATWASSETRLRHRK